jgi:hypothetical protein
MPSTSSAIAVGWSPFGWYSDLISKRTPPSDFSGRGGRCGVQTFSWPSSPLNSGTAVADQILQRVGGRLDAERLHLVARRPGQRLVVVLCRRQPELPREFWVERGDGGRGAVIGLRGFFETLARCIAFGDVIAGSLGRSARAMRCRLAAGAAVPRIVRWRLQAGTRTHAGIAAIDRGIEQFGQRRPDRLHLGPVGFGFRGFRFLGNFGSLRHDGNMGLRQAAEKAEIGNSFCSPAANPWASALLPATDSRGRHITRPG